MDSSQAGEGRDLNGNCGMVSGGKEGSGGERMEEDDLKIHDDEEGRSAKTEYQQGTPLLTDGRFGAERD